MKNANRKRIPKSVKEDIRRRQKGTCACCPSIYNLELHHVHPVCLGGKDSYFNLVYLCKRCHAYLHLGNLDIGINVLEYVYYLYNGHLPEDPWQIQELNFLTQDYNF